MIQNNATVKMITNILDGTTPISGKAFLNTLIEGQIVMFDREVNPAEKWGGTWQRTSGYFPYFGGGGYFS